MEGYIKMESRMIVKDWKYSVKWKELSKGGFIVEAASVKADTIEDLGVANDAMVEEIERVKGVLNGTSE
jgi:hypothetical protein